MIALVFSLDYEIQGNGDGDPYRLMVEPTQRMLDMFDDYGARVSLMADVGEILTFLEYSRSNGEDRFSSAAILGQLKHAIGTDHDVQLHLHPSFLNARWCGSGWDQDWREYNLATLESARIDELIAHGKQFLEDLLRPIAATYRCVAFRSANWAASPSPGLVRALVRNGFKVETSVFKYGKRSGIIEFDYTGAPHALFGWRVSESDICREDPSSSLIEIPIYCELRRLSAFWCLNRLYRVLQSKLHPIPKHAFEGDSPVSPGSARIARGRSLAKRFGRVLGKHAWKADFNQCTSRQLIQALLRAEQVLDRELPNHRHLSVPFVLIGHSKLFTRINQRDLHSLLGFIRGHPERFRFARISEFAADPVGTPLAWHS